MSFIILYCIKFISIEVPLCKRPPYILYVCAIKPKNETIYFVFRQTGFYYVPLKKHFS